MFRVVFLDRFESAYTLGRDQPQLEIGRLVNQNEPVPGQVKLDSKVISRKHAILMLKDDKLYLQDTKSSSGTFVNGKRLSPPSQQSEWVMLTSSDTVVFGEDCEVDGISHKSVSMVCKQLQKEISQLAKLKTQRSTTSLQSEAESVVDQYLMEDDARNDIKEEFEAIWDTLQNGLEPHVKQYQRIAYPYMKAMRQTGIYGDFSAKQEVPRYSTSSIGSFGVI